MYVQLPLLFNMSGRVREFCGICERPDMTRLVKEDLFQIDKKLARYDLLFKKQTGKTIIQTAKAAAEFTGSGEGKKCAVIPVTAGLGIITDFSETVAGILKYAGADAFVTKAADVSGLKEAYEKGCELAFLADDDTFLACSLKSGVFADNGKATGYGFAQALLFAIESRRGSAKGQRILVLGAGPVGRAAAHYIAGKGAIAVIYDIDRKKQEKLLLRESGAVAAADGGSCENCLYIIDATTQGNFIDAGQVCEDTLIAAPGMPPGPTRQAMEKAVVIHNPLELGTLTMYFMCLKEAQDNYTPRVGAGAFKP